MELSTFANSKRLNLAEITIQDGFWNKRLKMNSNSAIFYQWDQLEKQHNQDNFRILAGKKEGYRSGFFYCDSDLHKWVDAAARILNTTTNEPLSALIHNYITLMEKVQQEDGYLYTYNQFHFPDRRWANIQIEHELYCLGHMIEAAVSYMETKDSVSNRTKLLGIAYKAADLLVETFQKVKPKYTPGHQEIEIALIRLYRYSSEKKYLDLASKFLEQRGKDPIYGLRLISQTIGQRKRSKTIERDKQKKNIIKETQIQFFGGETKHQKEAPFLGIRSTFQYLSGRYHQQNRPIKRMKRPYGHSVRWGYFVTAVAMLYQERGNKSHLKALERTWEHLIQKQMFVTGGIGALGIVEGFGRDYELYSDSCYCETCAAIANILLNWELALITPEAKYSDLLEWQLYNAMSVGIALDGKSYLYRNLLESDGQLVRKDWFTTPCCPSNVSRIWASIGEYICSFNKENIWIHQYIGCSTELTLAEDHDPVKLKIHSQLPWDGKVTIKVTPINPQEFTLN
ncbi:MAG: glycoside hydrolase family 127 protein, partial [Candidatus Heimdallarchaeota archaeon]